jgi:hypothetical protein
MEHLGSHGADFHEILYLIVFRKSVEKIQVPLKSDENKRVLYYVKYSLFSTDFFRQATDDNKIRRMRFTCWITKATYTHT